MTMTPTTMRPGSGSVTRAAPGSGGLYDVLDLILDKGLVIDAYVRVSVVGIELLTIDLRVVVASVDPYLRFAEAVDRLHLQDQGGAGLDDLMGNGNKRRRGSSENERRALNSGDDGNARAVLDKLRDAIDDDDNPRSVARKVRKALGNGDG